MELPAAAKFCMECGARVAGGAPTPRPVEPAGARKIVSILFADLVGSTGLHERLDPESARRFMESYYAVAREAVESHGGKVTQFLGDGVKAVFGIPRVAEDDAIRAVRAGVAMQEGFRALADQQRVAVGDTGLRVAVNTGEVVAEGETEIIGDPVNVAARLQERGRDGDVVIGESTERLVATLVSLDLIGSFDLKGRAVPVKAYRVLSLEASRRAAAAFVGREDELARIDSVYARAVEKPATQVAVVLGSPGLGKSRLIGEFARRRSAAATVIAARCDAAGGATFAPIADALREHLGIDAGASTDEVRATVGEAVRGDDAERVAAGIVGLLTAAAGAPEETFFVVRRFLAALTESRPVVLIVDDLQWAEPLLLDLVEHLVQWGSDLPLLLLIGARPELREVRSSLALQGGLVADVLFLDGLDATAAMRLAAGVIGADDLPAAVAAKVLATSEGNPLFIGELVRMLATEGAITRDGDRWVVGEALATIEMPPTIHAVLAARIERLDPLDCSILECAAVVGRHFSRNAVAGLLPRGDADLDARLESLQRAELIERDTGWFLGEPVLRFHHVLIRDAAYRRLLKWARADLHERHAEWIEARVGDSHEQDEVLGRHFEEAHRILGELGPIDDAGQRLGDRAAARLSSAGRRALEADDASLAGGLLGRALERLTPDDATRADLTLDWCEALLSAGDVGAAPTAIDELLRVAGDSERLRAWHTCFQSELTILTAPDELSGTVDVVASAATSLASLEDAAGEAKGHFVHALALSRLGQVGACEASLDRALAAARRADDRRRANTVLAIAPRAALWGPSAVTRASGRCLDVVRVLRITQGAPAVEAVALSCQGVLEALRGRGDAARRMIASGREMVEELGIAQRLHEADVFAGFVALLEGDLAAAERLLRDAYVGLRDLGLGIDAARAAALLGRVMLAQDHVDEADALSRESESLAGDDLKAAIAWRGVRAEALARRGEHDEAVAFARAGVDIAATTDALLDHADARRSLAVALRASGNGSAADEEDARAHRLWEDKGATLLSEWAGETVVGREATVRSPDASGWRDGLGRFRPNRASRTVARLVDALAAGDLAAARSGYRDDYIEINHPTGASLDADGSVAGVEPLLRSPGAYFSAQGVATLGDSLALVMRRSGARSAQGERFDVGSYENDAFHLFEADERGLMRRAEIFASDRLWEAIARLYEWYAESLGGEAERGAARVRARVMRRWSAAYDLDYPEAEHLLDPRMQLIDHRTLGSWRAGNRDEAIAQIAALRDVASAATIAERAVLAAEPTALLRRSANVGVERVGGGAYEREYLTIHRFADDGRLILQETFDVGDEVHAYARFEELTGGSTEEMARKRSVRPNVATRISESLGRTVNPRGEDGLVAHLEAWDGEDTQSALHRFEELADVGSSVAGRDDLVAVFTNAAVRAMRRVVVAQAARDLDAIAATFADDFRGSDRRALLRVDTNREDYLEAYRSIVEMTSEPPVGSVVATRGDRLAIVKWLWRGGAGNVGPSEIEMLHVIEVDERGDHTAVVTFDPTDVDAAHAELDARFEAGEGASCPVATRWLRDNVEGVNGRDWEAVYACHADDLVSHDHRLAGWGARRGPVAFYEGARTLIEMAPDARWRIEHVRVSGGGLCLSARWIGTREGGSFESPFLAVVEFDLRGRASRIDLHDPVQVDAALARFAEPTEGATPAQSNAASRAMARWLDTYRIAFDTGNWGTMRETCSAGCVFEDRRRMALVTGDVELMLASARERVAVGALIQATDVGTAGDRIVLQKVLWSGGPADGPFEIEYDGVFECDEAGRISAFVLFDLEDARLAQREAWERWAAIDPEMAAVAAPVGDVIDAFNEQSAEKWRAAFADDLVVEDHRLAGLGRIEGADAYTESIVALWKLAPDTYGEMGWRWPAIDRHGAITIVHRSGTLPDGGGDFESEYLYLYLVAGGRITYIEVFEMNALEQALARFEELRPATLRSLVTPPPNAVSRMMFERWLPAYETCARTGDWELLRATMHPNVVMEYHQRLSLVSVGLEQHVVSLQERAATDQRAEVTLLATAGDRLGLFEFLWSGGPPDGRFEIGHLTIAAVDASGLCTFARLLDADERSAASTALMECYVASEAEGLPAGAVDLIVGWNEHDSSRARRGLCDDLVLEDHRLAGLGRLEGADAYLDSVSALHELAPDAREEIVYIVRVAAHGAVSVMRRWGTNTEGGAFETVYALIVFRRGDLVSRMEVFELEHLDTALERFEEAGRV